MTTRINDTPEQFQRALDLVKDPHGIRLLIIAHDELLAALRLITPVLHADTSAKGKADYSVVRDAITNATTRK